MREPAKTRSMNRAHQDHYAFGISVLIYSLMPIPAATRPKALVCDCPLAGIEGSNPAECMDICLLWVLCCSVEVSASGWSLVQRSLSDYGVSNKCDREAPLGEAMTWNRVEAPHEKKSLFYIPVC